jgi:SAM-dependent methyltransferase
LLDVRAPGYICVVELSDAIDLIRPAVGRDAGTWADFGAGTGLFSRALAAILDGRGRVIAIDRDARALRALERHASDDAPITTVVADVREPDAIPALGGILLDGAVFANVLHYMAEPDRLLARLVGHLAPYATVVVVEYDRRGANRWVPYPLPVARLGEVARKAGFTEPEVVARRPSAYQGAMYCARLRVRAPNGP